MKVTRRGFLRIAGGSAVVLGATAAGGAGFAVTRRPDRALEPWTTAGRGYADARIRALSYAILAPNPHNRQPWVVDLDRADEATLHVDLERRLPATDPFDRQITIGLGCFLELMRLAAAEEGIVVELEPFPDGAPGERLDARPVARARFTPGAAAPDPLFAQVYDRRSTKKPFDPARVPSPDQRAALAAAAAVPGIETGFAVTDPMVANLRDLTWRAWEVELATPQAWRESVELMRIGKEEVNATPDGIDIRGTVPELLHAVGVLSREAALDPDSTMSRQTRATYREIFARTPAFVWQVARDNSRTTQLAAGRAWLRLHLAATALGLDLHPVSQALQEYPAMDAIRSDLAATLQADAPRRVQMLGRIGQGPAVPPSPRWPVETTLRRA